MSTQRMMSYSLLALLLILAGCQALSATPTVSNGIEPITPVPGAETKPPVVSPAATMQPTLQVLTTSSPTVKPDNTITAFPSISPSPQVNVTTNCLEILPALPLDSDRAGLLVLYNPDTTYLMDMATGMVEMLPKNDQVGTLDGSAVSPDGRWLFYQGAASFDATSYSNVVRSADGMQQVEFTDKDVDYAGLGYWLDNERLALHRINPEGLDWVVVYNPFTDEKQVLKPDYPEIISDDWERLMWATGITTYDPTLTRVVYLAGEIFDSRVVLWDRQSNQAVVEIPDFTHSYRGPLWSPDGTNYIFPISIFNELVRRQEFFLVNQDGNYKQITDLNKYYSNVKITDFSWSPNGRYIGFWVNQTIAVLDVSSGKVTDYCISTSRADALPPFWSLDSQHLVIGVADPGEVISRSILIDLIEGYAAVITEDAVPEGWMISSP